MDENKTKREIVVRLSIVYIAIVLFALIVIGKVLYLQVVEHEKWANANTITQKDIIIEPDRGNICADDGRILATSVPYYEIRMDMKCPALTNAVFSKNIDSLAICLSRLFYDYPASEYKRKLISARYRGERYYMVKNHVDYIQLKKLKQFPIFRLGQYKGGVIYSQENTRIQPFVNLANRTIGYQGKGGTKVGIEGAFDGELRGEKGVRLVQKIAGNYWMPVNDGNEVEPINGKDIITTLDVNLQDVAQHALRTQLQSHGASHGTAILMEVQTGEVKAIVNLKQDENGNYTEQYNYAIGERTEPGSTFKLASLMAAMEDGYIDLDDTIDTGKGEVKYYKQVVKDTKEGGNGKITVQRVFEVSSNVGVSKIITQYYSKNPERFINRLNSMSLNKNLDLDIKGERPPYIKSPDDTLWSGVSLPQMAYGYEVEQTPMQVLTFYNAVANNGKMVRPHFVKAITDHGEIVKRFGTGVINASICSRATIKKAKKMLEGVVENGTAQNLKNSTYKIAGKTGTAQIANRKYGYKSQARVSYQASFVGYFPADKPRYSCIVVINAPSSAVYYGNLVAGPVFKEIADKVYATDLELNNNNFVAEADDQYNVPYTRSGSRDDLNKVLEELKIPVNDIGIKSEWVGTQKLDSTIRLTNRYVTDQLVPNVVGMGAKDALFILENAGLRVIIDGRGAVIQQSLTVGSRYRSGDLIVLKMS